LTARIGSLHCYPLKSGAGLDLAQASLTSTGVPLDRNWMVVTPAGRFLTQRELPRLALIRPEASVDSLVLHCVRYTPLCVPLKVSGERLPVQIWKDSCIGIDQGDEAAAWLQAILARECRLVRFDPEQRRLSASQWTGSVEAENRFSDGFPLLVIGSASLADLNARLPRPLPMNRFRPNLVLEGLAPYEEDRIDELHGENVRLKLVKPCTRCRITTTEQSTGELDGEEPLRTLKTYRFDASLRGVVFGQNAIILDGLGTLLRRGEVLQVRWK
jgi:uncharacterized protein YcbX